MGELTFRRRSVLPDENYVRKVLQNVKEELLAAAKERRKKSVFLRKIAKAAGAALSKSPKRYNIPRLTSPLSRFILSMNLPKKV